MSLAAWALAYSRACAGLPPQSALPSSAAAVAPMLAVPAPSPAPATEPVAASPEIESRLFAGLSELPVELLVQEVLARNPSLEQMIAAWQAASARYPQVTSLDDPTFAGNLGPGSFGSNKVDFAYRLELSQKYLSPGKLRLRGENVGALASAAGHEVEDTRLQLIEGAKHAFSDYYLADRALAVNRQALQLLHEFRDNAASRYRVGQAPEQDVLQADVEIGRQEERQVTLEALRQIAIARINVLLHLSPENPLPRSPEDLQIDHELPAAQELRATALARRPDLQAIADRIRAEQAALALAYKDFCPDFDVMAAYDSFWQEKELRPMIGVRLNLPIRTARRYGAISEAEARIAQRRAELARLTDEVNFQVQEAYEQVRKAERIVGLYRKTILQAAQANVKSAQSGYVAAKIPFLNLIEAERNIVDLQDRYYEAMADYFRRRATLERVVGGPLEGMTNDSTSNFR